MVKNQMGWPNWMALNSYSLSWAAGGLHWQTSFSLLMTNMDPCICFRISCQFKSGREKSIDQKINVAWVVLIPKTNFCMAGLIGAQGAYNCTNYWQCPFKDWPPIQRSAADIWMCQCLNGQTLAHSKIGHSYCKVQILSCLNLPLIITMNWIMILNLQWFI